MTDKVSPCGEGPAGKEGESGRAWYCVRSQAKHEHIAATNLRSQPDIEVFVPRIRFRRPTQKGQTWVTEAVFPTYFFARFDWKKSLRFVLHCSGVSGVVHFGLHWPAIPGPVIDSLRSVLGGDEVYVIPEIFSEGDSVRIKGGSFHDFEAVITHVMPGRQRVAVLLDFLGRQATVEVALGSVVKQDDKRTRLLT